MATLPARTNTLSPPPWRSTGRSAFGKSGPSLNAGGLSVNCSQIGLWATAGRTNHRGVDRGWGAKRWREEAMGERSAGAQRGEARWASWDADGEKCRNNSIWTTVIIPNLTPAKTEKEIFNVMIQNKQKTSFFCYLRPNCGRWQQKNLDVLLHITRHNRG